MKWVLLVSAALGGLLLAATLIGACLPREHRATRRAVFRQPPETLWKVLTDVEGYPSWRPDLTSVERISDARHAEIGPSGRMTFERVGADPPRRLVRRIADPDLPFGGTWTYLLEVDGGSTTLRITEDGEVYNPLFRFMSRFVFGHAGTMEKHLRALGRKFGEEVEIRG